VPRPADILILETTFGLPKFLFPPAAEVLAAIVKWCLEAIEEGEIPVLMAYSLGKAQELLLSLHGIAPELTFQIHDSVAAMNAVVASLGYPLPECERFRHHRAAERGTQPRGAPAPEVGAPRDGERVGDGTGREVPLPVRRGLSPFGPRGL
jgi:Cft2 family RNA processing exonuclease